MIEMGNLIHFLNFASENVAKNVIVQDRGQPCCSKMIGTTPSKRPAGFHILYVFPRQFFGNVGVKFGHPTLTCTQTSAPLGSEMWTQLCAQYENYSDETYEREWYGDEAYQNQEE